MQTRITELLNIKYPIFQGGMAWVADGDLAGAVSKAGGLGIIGGGNAPKEVVKANIDKIIPDIANDFFTLLLINVNIPKSIAIIASGSITMFINGANDILEEFEKQLKIKKGETTKDLMFSIVETRCVGECAMAPVVTVNDKVYPKFNVSDVDDLLTQYREMEVRI